jgi:hypothetical protein
MYKNCIAVVFGVGSRPETDRNVTSKPSKTRAETEDRIHYCQFPKLAVLPALSFSHFSNQSLAAEPLIAFPIRLQIGPSWM